MNYRKPEVSTLGSASVVIEQVHPLKPNETPYEPFITPTVCQPAYDLDE
jgi:hypothetical protein